MWYVLCDVIGPSENLVMVVRTSTSSKLYCIQWLLELALRTYAFFQPHMTTAKYSTIRNGCEQVIASCAKRPKGKYLRLFEERL